LANIIVFVEIRRDEATVASRLAVAEARRVASELGATVYAVIATGPASEAAIEAHGKTLGEAGADRILCCSDAALGGPLLDAAVGPVLAALAQRLRPLLTLFPAGAVGPALGPPLAMRLGGLYHARASLEVVRDASSARLALRRFRGDGAVRTLDVGAAHGRPTVATLPAGPDPGRRGAPAVEVEMLPYVAGTGGTVRELSSEPDDAEAVELAPVVLAVSGEVKPAELAALRAAAPPGAAVVHDGERPPGLDVACPGRVLVAGKSAAASIVRRTLAPGTRVAVAGGKTAEKDLGRIDVVWRPAKEGLSPLVAALSGTNRAEGGR
jgi:electron transfer flavoprotein alpha subunit